MHTSTHTVDSVYNNLYSAVNGYALSSAAKERNALFDNSDFTYGEVTPSAMQELLEHLPQQRGVFYDLGSGTGKAVILASMLKGFDKCVGVELLQDLHESAVRVQQEFEQSYKASFETANACSLEFRNENILETDLSDADVILGHCITCFSETSMQAFIEKCTQIRPGAVVLGISRSIAHPCFDQIAVGQCQMGWGAATVYTCRRNNLPRA